MTTTQRTMAVVVAVALLVGGVWYWQQQQATQNSDQQIKSPHFLDSTPLHDEVYAAQPINLTINFDFDLAEGSAITVRSADGQEWQDGTTVIEDAQTALKVPLRHGMPNGQYHVEYTACWPDNSCHEGRFSFAIDSRRQSEYQDHRGQKEITIIMKDLAFHKPKILISPGTTLTWINDDTVGHFVNTETHPEHTYFVPQNSREMSQGESFTTTFDMPGQYNYHCSAHVPEGMLGSIVVSDLDHTD